MPYHREINDDTYVVYAIDRNHYLDNEIAHFEMYPEDSDQFLTSYIGVTNRPYKRFKEHDCLRNCREPGRVCYYIKEHELTFNRNFRVIFEGTKEECLLIENYLRPRTHMGLNEAIGGGEKKYRVTA